MLHQRGQSGHFSFILADYSTLSTPCRSMHVGYSLNLLSLLESLPPVEFSQYIEEIFPSVSDCYAPCFFTAFNMIGAFLSQRFPSTLLHAFAVQICDAYTLYSQSSYKPELMQGIRSRYVAIFQKIQPGINFSGRTKEEK
jgi:hypothetical protein